MYYTIYTVTNVVNGKKYHGKHRTLDPNDSYIGTGGRHYRRAIVKDGRKSFVKTIRILCRSQDIMDEMEEYLSHVEDWPSDPNCYNEDYGGHGGNPPSHKGLKRSIEAKLNYRKSKLGRNNPYYGTTPPSTNWANAIASCIHCHRSMNIGNIVRYHGDRCTGIFV